MHRDTKEVFQEGKGLQPEIGNLEYEVKRLEQEISLLSQEAQPAGAPQDYQAQRKLEQNRQRLDQAQQEMSRAQENLRGLEQRLSQLAQNLRSEAGKCDDNARKFRDQASKASFDGGRSGLEDALKISQDEAYKHRQWADELEQTAKRASSAASRQVHVARAGAQSRAYQPLEQLIAESQASLGSGGRYNHQQYNLYKPALNSTTYTSNGSYTIGSDSYSTVNSRGMKWMGFR